jgi:hypothetical protein
MGDAAFVMVLSGTSIPEEWRACPGVWHTAFCFLAAFHMQKTAKRTADFHQIITSQGMDSVFQVWYNSSCYSTTLFFIHSTFTLS